MYKININYTRSYKNALKDGNNICETFSLPHYLKSKLLKTGNFR